MEGFDIWLGKRLKRRLPGADVQMEMVPPASRSLRLKPIHNPVLSSVLLLLFKEGINWSTVFIKRPEYEGHHSGQISLPGGKMEPGDIDLRATALREAEEEIGIQPEKVNVIGKLTEVQIPVSGFTVEPFVGIYNDVPVFTPDPHEVDRIIKADITFLTHPGIKDVFRFSRNDLSFDAPYYKLDGEKLWGATAMMMREFEDLLREYFVK